MWPIHGPTPAVDGLTHWSWIQWKPCWLSGTNTISSSSSPATNVGSEIPISTATAEKRSNRLRARVGRQVLLEHRVHRLLGEVRVAQVEVQQTVDEVPVLNHDRLVQAQVPDHLV